MKPFIIKPYSRRELSDFYGVDPRTLKRMLKPFEKKVGELSGRFYSPKQVEVIISSLGLPKELQGPTISIAR